MEKLLDAMTLLHSRVSVTRLCDPAPSAEQREQIFQAALRAPDHARLRPWRFLQIEGTAREALGVLFANALLQRNPTVDKAELERVQRQPLRAPLVIVAIASPKPHPRVPPQDQWLAVGCAVHGMLLAAHALGVGAVWRTGEMANDPKVAEGLGLSAEEQIISFLYLGRPEKGLHQPPEMHSADFFQAWPDK